jgi:hypothetical protein
MATNGPTLSKGQATPSWPWPQAGQVRPGPTLTLDSHGLAKKFFFLTYQLTSIVYNIIVI